MLRVLTTRSPLFGGALLLYFFFSAVSGVASSVPKAAGIEPSQVTVTVKNLQGDLVADARVDAYSRDWGWCVDGTTGADGTVVLRLAEGRWAFRATAPALYAIELSVAVAAPSASVSLQPDVATTLEFSSPRYSAAQLSGLEVNLVEASQGHVFKRQSIAWLAADSPSATIETNNGLVAHVCCYLPPSGGRPGLVDMSDPITFIGDSRSVEVGGSRCALYRFSGTGPDGGPVPQVHLQFHLLQASWPWAPWIRDFRTSSVQFYLSPHDFYCLRATDLDVSRSPRIRFQPLHLAPQPGQAQEFPMGGALTHTIRAIPRANTYFKPNTQVMLYTEDAFGNPVTGCWVSGERRGFTAELWAGAESASLVSDSLFAKLAREFYPEDNPTVTATWDWEGWGSGSLTLELYDPDVCNLAIAQTPRLIDQTSPTNTAWRAAFRASLEQLATAMEEEMLLPTDFPMGVIDNILHAGFENEALHGFKLELGISLDRPVGWPAGDEFIAHEMGHGRIHKPPAVFRGPYLESMASHQGALARTAMLGDPEFFRFTEGSHRLFLDHLHGTLVSGRSDEIEVAEFLYEYVRLQVGPHVVRDYVLGANYLLERVFGHTQPSVAEDIAILSHMAELDFGPLAEQAGLPVTAAEVEACLAALGTWRDTASAPSLSFSTASTAVEWQEASIQFCLDRAPPPGVSAIEADITVDGRDVTLTRISPRHLSWTDGWTFSANPLDERAWHVSITAPSPARGPGALAHVVLGFLPATSPQSSVMVRAANVRVNGTAIPEVTHVVSLPSAPVIRELPLLPQLVAGRHYGVALTAFGGTPPYTWTLSEGSLPAGLALGPDGVLHGIAESSTGSQFTARVADQSGTTAYRVFDFGQGRPQAFADVGVGYWAFDEVEACYDERIVWGYPDGLYHPLDPVKRDQMAVYIARAKGWVSIDDPMDTAPELFPDVPAGQWAGTAIQACVDNNVVAGYPYPDPHTPGETFYLYAPSETVTRDQMAVYIARALVAPTGEAALADYVPASPRNFPDVPATGCGDDGTDPYWAYTHIEYCAEHGVVQGYEYPDPDTPGETISLYQPLWPVTRDQMAVYIARAFELPI